MNALPVRVSPSCIMQSSSIIGLLIVLTVAQPAVTDSVPASCLRSWSWSNVQEAPNNFTVIATTAGATRTYVMGITDTMTIFGVVSQQCSGCTLTVAGICRSSRVSTVQTQDGCLTTKTSTPLVAVSNATGSEQLVVADGSTLLTVTGLLEAQEAATASDLPECSTGTLNPDNPAVLARNTDVLCFTTNLAVIRAATLVDPSRGDQIVVQGELPVGSIYLVGLDGRTVHLVENNVTDILDRLVPYIVFPPSVSNDGEVLFYAERLVGEDLHIFLRRVDRSDIYAALLGSPISARSHKVTTVPGGSPASLQKGITSVLPAFLSLIPQMDGADGQTYGPGFVWGRRTTCDLQYYQVTSGGTVNATANTTLASCYRLFGLAALGNDTAIGPVMQSVGYDVIEHNTSMQPFAVYGKRGCNADALLLSSSSGSIDSSSGSNSAIVIAVVSCAVGCCFIVVCVLVAKRCSQTNNNRKEKDPTTATSSDSSSTREPSSGAEITTNAGSAHADSIDTQVSRQGIELLVGSSSGDSAAEVVKVVTKPAREFRRWIPGIDFKMERQAMDHGAYGTVHKGIEIGTSRLIAVKQILATSMRPDEIEQELTKLQRETDMLSKMTHHNVVHYLGSGYADGIFYVIMELAEGGSIKRVLEQYNGGLSENTAAGYMIGTVDGLCEVHRCGVVHRDLKCANILVTNKGEVKIADFGTARHAVTVVGSAGTPMWMAPEVAKPTNNAQISEKSDIWSLGCTLMEMLTGEVPFHHLGDSNAFLVHLIHDEGPVSIPHGFGEDATDFMRQCLQRNPDDRPTAEELSRHPFLTDDRANPGASRAAFLGRTQGPSAPASTSPGGGVVNLVPHMPLVALAKGTPSSGTFSNPNSQ